MTRWRLPDLPWPEGVTVELVVSSNDPAVLTAIEEAAEANGLELELVEEE